jgi:hypothetical protein
LTVARARQESDGGFAFILRLDRAEPNASRFLVSEIQSKFTLTAVQPVEPRASIGRLLGQQNEITAIATTQAVQCLQTCQD